jgi:RNA polymerase sigma-70 factor (ECF subfamily)
MLLRCSPESWLDNHGDALYRVACRSVGDKDLAEDLVQETLISALRSADEYRGDCEERTWLIGILKRRIVDSFRKKARRPQESDVDLRFFDEDLNWRSPNSSWPDSPEELLENAEFIACFESCLEKVPESLAEPFRLREQSGVEAEDICSRMEISTTNLSTRLYRARMLLRKCLEANWFDQGEKR